MDRQLDEALKVLGIPADSDRETVASAYRRLARATHPDVSPDPDAAERFAIVTAAYRVVCPDVTSPGRVPGRSRRTARHRRTAFLHWPAPPPNLYQPVDFAWRLGDPAPDPGGARLLSGCRRSGPLGRRVAHPSWLDPWWSAGSNPMREGAARWLIWEPTALCTRSR